jgi:alpha-tubulin suppressor-like RCC1 family protein
MSTDETQVTLKALKPEVYGCNRKYDTIASVALGQDHTIVLTTNGEVYTFGSNEHGQLGYNSERSFESHAAFSPNMRAKSMDGDCPHIQAFSCQNTPKRVVQFGPKHRISGVAASRIHSVAYSHNGLYVWGRNEGQLGSSCIL